ncbi:MAG TPA: lamin tail domain-containing protein, partial [Verrucomicrobiales bacterium]|nr:lamin tail domain-containing protein [Verrucomicrobiales bacterium]
MCCLRLLPVLAVVLPCLARAQDSVVVFNELMYHPPAGQAEWIELTNVMSVNVDLSEWKLTGGVEFTFPAGTVIPAGGYLVVKGATGTAPAAALGPFSGALDNNGETVRLRNVSGRIMDEIAYGNDGRWPVGADGTGATLARRTPVSPGGEPESWVASASLGGTAGAVNFPSGPPVGPSVTLADYPDVWLYNQSGAALPQNWAGGAYAAGTGGWLSGAGIFAYENAALPFPTGTVLNDPVATNTRVHYFQKSFAFSGNPARTLLTANLLVDDGAVVYLNGHEVLRRNIAEGDVTAATRSQNSVSTATLSGPVVLPSEFLVNGTNVLSVSVHQPAALQPYVVLTGGGLALAEEAGSMDAANDLALASKGAVAFAKDLLGNGAYAPTHTIPNLNNGTYGNASSWIGDTANSFCGISLGATPVTLRSIAFGRDNTAGFTDRSLGLFTLQYTTVANPSAATPDASWTNIGTLNYQSAGGGNNFTAPSRRHRFNFTAVSATGIRLTCPGAGLGTGSCVDEIELYEQAGTVFTPSPLTIVPGSGYTVTWDGNNGPNPSPNAPPNLARAADGGVAFASGELGPSLGLTYHLVSNINDGKYTNPFSWIGANAANQYAAVKFGGLVGINKVAWGRDSSGAFTDRSLGVYTVQITTVPAPGTATAETGDSATGWKTVGTFTYSFSDPTFTQNMRHEYVVAQGGNPIPATALRIKVSDPGIDIEELEVYGAEQPDVVFGMSLTAAELLASAETVPVLLNEVGGSTDGVWRVELKNTGAIPVELGTVSLNGHTLPAGTLTAGTVIVLDEVQLGFRPASGEVLTLTTGLTLLDSVKVKSGGRARSGSRWLVPSAATFGSPNTFALHGEVAINEIMYHAPPFSSTPTAPVTDNPAEWIELKNRTASPVDLAGWKLDGEVSFTFPPGSTLPASGYLVVAGAGGTPPAGALGPFSGTLSNRGGLIQLEDASGNPANEVHYTGTGWSDGGGSSLELRDARSDNSLTTSGAWQDSDESGKSGWQTFTYRMTAGQTFGPSTWNEIRLGLLDAGECLLDDLSVVRDPDGAHVQVVQNGDFSAGAAHWRFLGNHRTSSVIPEPGNAGNSVLWLRTSGPAETNHNHIEGTLNGNTALTTG